VAYQIDKSKCIGCSTCAFNCPADAISRVEGDYVLQIDPEICLECGTCASVCPMGAISLAE